MMGEAQNMANTETEVAIDWMACELIEAVPGKVSGTASRAWNAHSAGRHFEQL
jgi:hypothetical protein